MSAENKVTVRVEVVIEGAGESARVTTTGQRSREDRTAGYKQQYKIDYPLPNANASVTVVGGKNCISAGGSSPVMGSSYAHTVWAIAYPTAGAGVPDQPPAGAVSDAPGGDGSWSFNVAKGNAVPGAATNGGMGVNNSTLAVWYEFNGAYPQVSSLSFHGYLPGLENGLASHAPRIEVLHASFRDSLEKLGAISLRWNGAGWVGRSEDGGCILSLQSQGSVYQLMAIGPATSFIVAGSPKKLQPFYWSDEGRAVGPLSGSFAFLITE